MTKHTNVKLLMSTKVSCIHATRGLAWEPVDLSTFEIKKSLTTVTCLPYWQQDSQRFPLRSCLLMNQMQGTILINLQWCEVGSAYLLWQSLGIPSASASMFLVYTSKILTYSSPILTLLILCKFFANLCVHQYRYLTLVSMENISQPKNFLSLFVLDARPGISSLAMLSATTNSFDWSPH